MVAMSWAEPAWSCSWRGEERRNEAGQLGNVGFSLLPFGRQAPRELWDPEGSCLPNHPLPAPWLQARSLQLLEQQGWGSPFL